MFDLRITFTGECWPWRGKGAWVFVTLPQDQSAEIEFFTTNYHAKRRGWGAVRVSATIGHTVWETSIFPDSQSGCYLLPLKREVRNKEKIVVGNSVNVQLVINV